ncbi:lactate utilization protein C [Helicobacter anseris]|uniref:Lactate utilization protein C n=1 Tax=Helicobacter anseris TaxID=375926 RepID=A0A3D8JAI6_9HELI|nr:lactate utilization protein C [Helicobacter anseris]RDU74300.1 lactate utilization protein C [Helicobacter anseris]
MSKNLILSNIKEALSHREEFLDKGNFRDIIKREQDDILQEYIRLQKSNMADVIISSKEKLFEDMQKLLLQIKPQKVLYANDLPCDMNKFDGFEKMPYCNTIETNREKMFDVDVSIVNARCGIANLGIMGLVSSVDSPRLTSLIAPHCIMLLDSTKIVWNLFEGIKFLKSLNTDLATNLLFIAGPSRTADIELKTVFGVHGPQKVSVILY